MQTGQVPLLRFDVDETVTASAGIDLVDRDTATTATQLPEPRRDRIGLAHPLDLADALDLADPLDLAHTLDLADALDHPPDRWTDRP
jgi:hypothetical protein